MKINEVVTLHPSLAAKSEYDRLLTAGDEGLDDIVAFIMDDNNPAGRRLFVLKHLDELLDTERDSYSAADLDGINLSMRDRPEGYSSEDLDDFMHDQGPSDWRSDLRKSLEQHSAKGDSYSWSHNKKYPPGTQFDFTKLDDMSAEEMVQFAKDLKIPPYHLAMVDETQDDEISTGEYEICQRCGGEGCIECEEGLKDITGTHKIPNFDDYKGE